LIEVATRYPPSTSCRFSLILHWGYYMTQEILKQVAEELIDSLKITDNTPIRRVNVYVFRAGDTLLDKEFCKEYYRKSKTDIIKECKDAYDFEDAIKKITIHVFMLLEDLKNSRRKQDFLGDARINLDDYKLCRDMEKDVLLLYNNKGDIVSKINPEAFIKSLPRLEREDFRDSATQSLFVFDPYDITKAREKPYETSTIMEINLYTVPPWQLGEVIPNAKCPSIIWEFLTHLIPDEVCRKHVLAWMHFALTDRCETYLVLCGDKGIGKGVFCSSLLKKLIGEDNYNEPPLSIFSKEFNGSMERKRLLVFDEVQVTTKANMQTAKRYINKYLSFEKKGVDATNATEIFSSNIMSFNGVDDLKLEWDERRFTVPELVETRLDKAWSKAKIKDLIWTIEEDEEAIKQFGYWILQMNISGELDPSSEYKGPHFWRIVYASLTGWQKSLVDAAISGTKAEIELKNVQGSTKKLANSEIMPKDIEKISRFLKGYKHLGEKVIGELIDNETIRFNPEVKRGKKIKVETPAIDNFDLSLDL